MGSTGTLYGTIAESPNASYTVEIFSNPTQPLAGQEQGKTFLEAVTVPTDGSGNGTFSLTEPAGVYYTADVTDPSSDTSNFSNAVGSAALAASQTAVSSSANPSTVGHLVTFTAVVTAPSYQGTPTGTITFTVDGQAQTPVTLALVGGSDQAQFTTSTLSAGPHTISASYSGDTNVGSSSGSLPTQTVDAPALQASTTTLQSTVNPSTTGQFVTFTAIVSAPSFQGTPTGTITFTIDGHAEAPIQLTLVGASGDAAFSTSTLSAGSHAISASYSGNSSVSPSSGSLPTQTVNAPGLAASTTTLDSSHNPSTPGQAVTFTAVVTAPSYQGTPTGTITFTVDGHTQTPVALALVGGSDQAQFTTSTLSAGPHSISASYSGDNNVSPSSGSLPTQTVSGTRIADNHVDSDIIAKSVDGRPARDLHGRCFAEWSLGNAIGNRDIHDRRRRRGAGAAPVSERQRSGHGLDRVPGRGYAHDQCDIRRRLVLRGKRRGKPDGPDGPGDHSAHWRRADCPIRQEVWHSHAADGAGGEFQRGTRPGFRGEFKQLQDHRSVGPLGPDQFGGLRRGDQHADAPAHQANQPSPYLSTRVGGYRHRRHSKPTR